jgi:hypothetical protein
MGRMEARVFGIATECIGHRLDDTADLQDSLKFHSICPTYAWIRRDHRRACRKRDGSDDAHGSWSNRFLCLPITRHNKSSAIRL